jgi:mono/diheme cytochrome c family protein
LARFARAAKVAAYLAALLIVSVAEFVCSGIYNVGADAHHSRVASAIIKQLRDRSISVRAREITVPNLEDPSKIVAGADRYARLCIGCHLAPGILTSELSVGMYPHPPNLANGAELDSQRLFWTIKHGVKMSAMPGWGNTLSDEEIWDLVALVRKLPAMSAASFGQLLMKRGAD